MMTVEMLIKRLQKLPQKAAVVVLISGEGGGDPGVSYLDGEIRCVACGDDDSEPFDGEPDGRIELNCGTDVAEW